MNETRISTTIAPSHLRHLGVDVRQSFDVALTMGFAHIRLGAYWSEIERTEHSYDFTQLKSLLNQCEIANQPVVLTIGVKAPRWPEFYWPDFLRHPHLDSERTQAKILLLIEHAIKELAHFHCITHWQVENEPLDPSGPDQKQIPFEFLKREVALVKRLDNRPVLLTTWGNTLSSRKHLPKLDSIADVIGIDLYYKQFQREVLGKSFYAAPQDSDQKIKQIISQSKKPVWITELQAEPWEKDDAGYRSANPKSISPSSLAENIQRAKGLSPNEIFLWGFEYWLYRQAHGDDSYLNLINAIIAQ